MRQVRSSALGVTNRVMTTERGWTRGGGDAPSSGASSRVMSATSRISRSAGNARPFGARALDMSAVARGALPLALGRGLYEKLEFDVRATNDAYVVNLNNIRIVK